MSEDFYKGVAIGAMLSYTIPVCLIFGLALFTWLRDGVKKHFLFRLSRRCTVVGVLMPYKGWYRGLGWGFREPDHPILSMRR